MLDRIAYCHAECKEDNLSDGEERSSEKDVSNRPAVLESAEDKDQL